MTKIFFLLFSCLLVVGKLDAQTDSTRPPDGSPAAVQDTAVHVLPVRHDSTVRHMSHRDSVRRDSINRAHRAIRDSLARVRQAAFADSAARWGGADSPKGAGSRNGAGAVGSVVPAGGGARGSGTVGKNPTGPIRDSPPALSFWMKVLRDNHYFNFTGTPVVQIFQIHRANSKDSLFYLLVGILFYFALTRVFFEKYFNNLLTLFFRVSLRQQQIREQVLQTPLPSLLLNILFIISGGLYACFLLHYSQIGANIRFWVLYLNCMLLLGTIYLVKFLVLKFVGWVFSISRATDIYIFIVFLVNKMLGIFLLPFLIIITFSGPGIREIFITISLAMVFVLWSYRVLAAYRPIRNEIKLTPFYFFLYLCAFEIAPLLLIYKVLLTYLEKVY
ncbi:MAG TPA: DUF4271 domain-containing protein [Puia sp.]|nr:DUF4271 domain-containing protein [Puia sp.]